MGVLMRTHDWPGSPLGSPGAWPQALKTAIGLMLGARQPVYVAWGPGLISFYNDGYLPIVGTKHPGLGLPFRDLWAEIWSEFRPIVEATMAGDAQHFVNLPIALAGRPDLPVGYFTFSYTALRDENGTPAGFYCAATETTEQVLAEQRQHYLLDLETALRSATTARAALDAACEASGRALGAVLVTFNEFDTDGLHLDVTSEWRAGDTPSAFGRHRLIDWGEMRAADLLSGKIERVDDVATDARTAGTAVEAAYAGVGCRASLNVPLLRDGGVRAMLAIGVADPRRWTPEDISLAQETVERAWQAAERARAEAALRKAEQDYRALFMGTPTPFLLLSPDPARFTIIDVNDAYLAATMTTHEGLVGRPLFEVFPDNPADASAVGVRTLRTSLEHALATRQTDAPSRLKYDIARPDGSFEERWWDPVNTPLLNADGKVAALLHHATDVTDALRAASALAGSEERLRLAVNNAEVGFWDVDPVNDVLTWPARTKAMFGIAAETPVSMADFYAGLHPDDLDETGAAFAEAADPARRALYDVEYRTIGKEDGIVRWVAAKGRAVFDGPCPGARCLRVAGTAIDITRRKATETALRESEARYRTLFETIDEGFCIVEFIDGPQGPLSDYVHVEANAAYAANAGIFSGIVGKRLREVVLEEEADSWVARFRRVLESGEPVRFEQELVATGRHLELAAFPAGAAAKRQIAVLFKDVTARRVAETQLRELNETLESQVTARSAERDRLWNLSQDLLARADYSGMMSAVSPAWTLVLGWSADELLTRPYAGLMHPDDMPPTLEAIGRMSETRRPTRFENRIATRDGGWKHIEWTVAPEPDGLNFIAVGRDLSLAKAREAELETAQDALRQAQKMEAMGQLTGGVAHDFNNLLTPIVGALDMLQRKALGGEREQRLIAGAMQSAERAKTLVQRLLAFARRQPLQPIPVDIAKLVTGMGDLVSSTTGPQIKVVVDAPGDLPPAKADPNQLEMALLNLGVNARDAMPDGGTLRISAGTETVASGHRSGLRPDTYVRLSVADTGAGMDEATLARAIEPFFSTKGVGKGTGLGLSMVHGLASQLGGALTIQSRPGLGTNVELWLPVSAAVPEAAPAAPELTVTSTTRGTALLVDDEELVRMSTADMLHDLGYEVIEAASGEEAMRLIGGGERFDLLVTDHLMPGMTGTDLVRMVREQRPGLPVLVVSGYAEGDGIEVDVPRLTKPFRKDELASSLQAIRP